MLLARAQGNRPPPPVSATDIFASFSAFSQWMVSQVLHSLWTFQTECPHAPPPLDPPHPAPPWIHPLMQSLHDESEWLMPRCIHQCILLWRPLHLLLPCSVFATLGAFGHPALCPPPPTWPSKQWSVLMWINTLINTYPLNDVMLQSDRLWKLIHVTSALQVPVSAPPKNASVCQLRYLCEYFDILLGVLKHF